MSPKPQPTSAVHTQVKAGVKPSAHLRQRPDSEEAEPSTQRFCISPSPAVPATPQCHGTLFFLLVGAGGLISFCKIRRHMRVIFSTTTGVLMFTAMRKRLSAGVTGVSQYMWATCPGKATQGLPPLVQVPGLHLFLRRAHPVVPSSPQRKRSSQQLSSLEMESVSSSISY